MPHAVACPHCAQKLKAPDNLAGKRVACPACRGVILIPPAAASPTTAPISTAPSPPNRAGASSKGKAADQAVVVTCPQCAKKLKAPPTLAGKRVKCPGCQSTLTIPSEHSQALLPQRQQPAAHAGLAPQTSSSGSSLDDDEILGLLGAATPPGMADLASAAEASSRAPAIRHSAASASPKAPVSAGKSPTATGFSPSARRAAPIHSSRRPRFLYLLFAIALVPLCVSTLTTKADEEANDVQQRFLKTIAAQPELADRITDETSDEELWAMLPEGRFAEAHLPHETWMHWIYALVASAVFLLAIVALFELGQAPWWKLLAVMAVTGTVGVLSLIIFQYLAEGTQGVWVRGRGWGVIIFLVIKFIGFSYRAALDPENGFLLSMMGFTFGVGLCEELTKVLPAVGVLGEQSRRDWRAACVIGLASGVGFGVAEGIMYSSHYYNGISRGDIYLIRFISCVALHAIWAAATAIFAAEKIREDNAREWSDLVVASLAAIAVPAVLHGLYDTLLKRDMPGYALVAAAASFAWLAIVVERARSLDAPASSGFRPAPA